MRIGLIAYRGVAFHSVLHVWRSTAAVLAERHELQPYPHEPILGAWLPPDGDALARWLQHCDAVVGPVDLGTLRARERLDRPVPYACFLLGGISSGAAALREAHPYLRASDVLIGNCTADHALATKFFPNATVRTLPFACDAEFFAPVDDAARQAARESSGIAAEERMLLYVGRITLEKNLHTLLKVFHVVQSAVPAARLVIAGEEQFAPFGQYAVIPLAVRRMLDRLVAHLGLNDGSVRFIGRRAASELRDLYNAADVLLNLTLHHDENFGLAQVEAMVCGLPVVGTTWGGLKDTIVNGVTGQQVPAIATASGVKVDWWQAANSIVEWLEPGERGQWLRARCRDAARACYAPMAYGRNLDQVLSELMAGSSRASEAIRPGPFAQRYWSARSEGGPLPTRLGSQGQRLYQELMATFATPPAEDVMPDAVPAWCLASPLSIRPDNRLDVNDPIYPLSLPVPASLARQVRTLVSRFTAQPVLATRTLHAAGLVNEALLWMHGAGLLLPTKMGPLDLSHASGLLGQPVFAIGDVDHRLDVVWLS